MGHAGDVLEKYSREVRVQIKSNVCSLLLTPDSKRGGKTAFIFAPTLEQVLVGRANQTIDGPRTTKLDLFCSFSSIVGSAAVLSSFIYPLTSS